MPGTDTEKALQRLHALLQEHPEYEREILAKLPAFAAQADSPLLATLQEAMQKFSMTPQPKQEPWFADAAFFARAHTEDEFVEIKQVAKTTAILRTVIRSVRQ